MTAEPRQNSHGQPVGVAVENWIAPAHVRYTPLTKHLQGRLCILEPLNEGHELELRESFKDMPDSLWTYLPYGPMTHASDFTDWMHTLTKDKEGSFAYLVRDHEQRVLGVTSYLRIAPEAGSIEIGHLCFTPGLQQTSTATEALYLMIEAVFLLGYRRCEWKCNDLNAPSIRSAKRLGFRYEGTFRQTQVIKGANRNTAWFSIIDSEWTALRPLFESWLAPNNFGDNGEQQRALSEMTKALLTSR